MENNERHTSAPEMERYGTVNIWSRELGLANATIQSLLESVPAIMGKDANNKIRSFYEEGKVREAVRKVLMLPKADETGFIKLDGCRYGTVASWSREWEIGEATVAARFTQLPHIEGRGIGGQVLPFYAENAVKTTFEALVRDLPHAEKDGFFEREQVRYGTIIAWCRQFDLSETETRRNLKGIPGIEAKIGEGRTRTATFYPEALIRERCGMDDIPFADDGLCMALDFPLVADENGFFEHNEEQYGSIVAWEKEFGMSRHVIEKNLSGTRYALGRTSMGGKQCKFYTRSAVEESCGNHLEALPMADESGFFSLGSEKYANASTWSKQVGMSHIALQKRMENVAGIQGKTAKGLITTFFAESDVRRSCAEHMQEDLRTCNDEGFFEKDGVTYGSKRAWGQKFSNHLSETVLHIRLRNVEGVKGKNRKRKISVFYSEAAVREQCADFFEDVPETNDEGFFLAENETYRSIETWSDILGLSSPTLLKRLSGCVPRKGKSSKSGKFSSYYAEKDVRQTCADLLRDDIPRAGDDNMITVSGVRFATCNTWGNLLNVSPGPLRKKMLKMQRKGMTGKDTGGHILEGSFFSENDANEMVTLIRMHPNSNGK